MNKVSFVLAAGISVLVSACGGGSDADEPSAIDSKNDIYLGFYAEDALNNPEDPMTGAFVINLPKEDGDFAGNMFFTYVGCQSTNVGKIAGVKTAETLSGVWSGTLDDVAHAGKFTGKFGANLGGYTGTYSNNGGKQYRDLRPCIEYHTAALGRWEVYPEGVATPKDFVVAVSGRSVTWSGSTGANVALLYLLDTTLADGARNPVVWQTLVGAGGGTLTVPTSVPLAAGRDYLVAVGLVSPSNERVAFGSKRFKAP